MPTNDDAQEMAIEAFISRVTAFQCRETENCPHCGTRVVSMQQIGSCTYAFPCECRLWQGPIPPAWLSAPRDRSA